MTHQTPDPGRRRSRWLACFDDRGQTVIETALVMPLLIVIAMGVVELGLALRDQFVVTRLSREGSNLTSRDTSLQDAATALISMSNTPVDFNSNSKLILSVLKRGSTLGTANYNHIILYQRYSVGTYSATSHLTLSGSGSFGGAPDYTAASSDTNTGLQVTNAPAGIASSLGDLVYVTEVFTQHNLLVSLSQFGITVPQQLYSIAYF